MNGRTENRSSHHIRKRKDTSTLPIDLARSMKNRAGSTAVEYAVLLCLISLVITAPLILMGKSVSKTLQDVDGAFVSLPRSPAGDQLAIRESAASPTHVSPDDANSTTSIGSSDSILQSISQGAGSTFSLFTDVKNGVVIQYDYLPEISFFLLNVLLIIPVYLQIRRVAGRKGTVSSQFVDLTYAIVNDAICIISPHIKVKIGGNDSVQEMMRGIDCLCSQTRPSLSVSERNLGLQAACVIYAVYGKVPSEITIPENILYEGAGVKGDAHTRQKRGLNSLRESGDKLTDQYNLAFNLVVDLWLKAFAEHKLLVTFPPRGAYRRDIEKNLRLFSYCAPDSGGRMIIRERTILTS